MDFGTVRKWLQNVYLYRSQSEPLGPNTVLERGDIVEVGGKEFVIQRGCLGSEFMDHIRAAETVQGTLEMNLKPGSPTPQS